MIPTIVGQQLENRFENLLKTQFRTSTPGFASLWDDFFSQKDRVVKGPYLQLPLPFRKGKNDNELVERFGEAFGLEDEIVSDPTSKEAADRLAFRGLFPPYSHQVRAFERLDEFEPTLVATGTGSGKTECFTLPILKYCAQFKNDLGIRAIFIYPMNALATDQAARLAKMIARNSGLHGVRVGLYIGENKGRRTVRNREMCSPDAYVPDWKSRYVDKDYTVITDRETLRRSPPHILLTNYKMLDYMLIRPEEHGLWEYNKSPETLRFLAVDELHTFDGAQAADLACLLRRLKERLRMPDENLCSIGTSATLGSDEKSLELIRDYAKKIFSVPFKPSSLIMEDRLTFEETKAGTQDPIFDEKIVEALFTALKGGTKTLGDLALLLKRRSDAELWEDREISVEEMKRRIVEAGQRLSALRESKGRSYPEVKIQYWTRELARMVASLPANGRNPHLEFADDLGDPDRLTDDTGLERRYGEKGVKALTHYLPVANCNVCGSTSYVGLVKKDHSAVEGTRQQIYDRYMDEWKRTEARLFTPLAEGEPPPPYATGGIRKLCPECKALLPDSETRCKCGATGLLRVAIQEAVKKPGSGLVFPCPHCGHDHGNLLLVGMRAATLLSTYISSLTSSPQNTDKKLLTFSDNVQDTSHRAGFFGGRTWAATFRSHMAHYIAEYVKEPCPLADFTEGFWNYLQYTYEDPRDLFARLIPQDLKWMNAWRDLVGEKSEVPPERALKQLKARLAWEIAMELGCRQHLGRTLTRLAIAGLVPRLPPEDDPRWKQMADHLANQTEGLRIFKDAGGRLRQCTIELAGMMLKRGAFDDGQDIVRKFLLADDYRRPLSSLKFEGMSGILKGMTPRGAHVTAPGIVLGGGDRAYIALEPLDPQCNLARKLERAGFSLDLPSLAALFESLENAGVLAGVNHLDRVHYWYLPQASFSIARIEPTQEQAANPYREQYLSGDLYRVNPAEHTGLLNRDEREELEKRFKAKGEDHHTWYPNLVSATPTLEMGVDIGDLSSVLLCSVPPTQSKFIQRIGRSGRTNGSALNITVANAKPHDLYFFREPEEMIEGSVTSPGVFLRAAAILQRQYFGFVLSEWMISASHPVYPKTLGRMLDDLKKNVPGAFPGNLFAWYAENKYRLHDRFISRLMDSTDDATRQSLRAFAVNKREDESSLEFRLYDEITLTNTMCGKYTAKQVDLLKLKKKILADSSITPDEKQTRVVDIELEIKSYRKLLANIRKQHVIEWLCDSAMLLPNYAFPEPGVKLQSVLWRREDETKPPVYEKIEIARPASSGLTELVPGETFYTHNHHMEIDQVDLAVYEDKEIEDCAWRICPDCDHVEPDHETTPDACPECGASWNDPAQKRNLLRARQFITVKSSKKTINDDSDDNRTPKFYDCRKFFELNRSAGGYRHFRCEKEDETFAFEYVPHLTMREVNFGLRGKSEDQGATSANGEQVNGQGFTICPSCWKAVAQRGGEAVLKPKHVKNCKASFTSEEGGEEPESLTTAFFREYHTEALRIFAPFIGEDDEKRVRSFLAAIQIGLKEHFHGEVDHLCMEVQSLPIKGKDCRRHFIILYDSVPGGTGYIRQFSEDENKKPTLIFDIFDKALSVLENCTCASDALKDGCYHCLYRYRNQSGRDALSRKAAIEVLKQLRGLRETIREADADDAAPGTDVSSLLESQLEALFINRLRNIVVAAGGEFHETNVSNYTKGFRLTVPGNPHLGGGESAKSWEIILQKDMGGDNGVLKPSRPDFVFQQCCPESEKKAKSVAVFLDGWEYHQGITDDDTLKRMALKAAGYRVWSLDWDNVASPSTHQKVPDAPDWLTAVAKSKGREKLGRMFFAGNANREHSWNEYFNDKAQEIDRLFAYLQTADDAVFERHANFEAALLAFSGADLVPAAAITDLPVAFADLLNGIQPRRLKDVLFTGALCSVPDSSAIGGVSLRLAAKLDDSTEISQDQWRSFFACLNYFQFLDDGAFFFTQRSREDQLWSLLKNTGSSAVDDDAWQEALSYVRGDGQLTEVIEGLRKIGVAVPLVFTDYAPEGCAVAFTPFFQWPDKKVMVVNAEDLTEDNRPPDWNVITITAETSAEQIVVDVKGALKHV